MVDAEGSIQIRVVDKAFPADRGAGLLEVDTHDDFKVPRETAAFCDESLRILTGRFRVMDRAGADNDEKAVIFAFMAATFVCSMFGHAAPWLKRDPYRGIRESDA